MKKELIFLILTIIFLGCKKDQDPELEYQTLAPEGLSYIQLPLGSHYIYRDSATAIEDSIIVVTSLSKKTYSPAYQSVLLRYDAFYYQVYTLELKSANILPNNFWFSASTAPASAVAGELYTFKSILNYIECTVFSFPTDGRFISSMVVEGNTYNDIEKYVFESTSSNPSQNITAVYYWAKGVGIIKRQITINGSTKTESLIRHGY